MFISLFKIFDTSRSICSFIFTAVLGFPVNLTTGSIAFPIIFPCPVGNKWILKPAAACKVKHSPAAEDVSIKYNPGPFLGSTTHYLKGTLDYKMGFMIVIGGAVGTILGIITFTYFQDIGKINIVISLSYMYILAIIGTIMLVQGVSEIDRARRKIVVRKKLHSHYWIHGLPFRMRFKKSKLYESAFTPIIIGLVVGFIAAIMGVGGAFILVPAMIYIIGMPTKLIPGTSLFVTIFVSAIVTVLHAFNYGSIDLLLVMILICGSILGVQIGQKVGEKFDSSQFKTILAVLLLLVGIAIAYLFELNFFQIDNQ